jgi:hypothetical protein
MESMFDSSQSEQHRLFCVRCGYDLHGLVHGVCPECGAQFDPKKLRANYAHLLRWWHTKLVLDFLYGLCLLPFCTALSVAIQLLRYSARTGPRSREWIVHNLPAPFHYIFWSVGIPGFLLFIAFALIFIRRLQIYKHAHMTKHMRLRASMIVGLCFSAILLAQCSCLYRIATLGD